VHFPKATAQRAPDAYSLRPLVDELKRRGTDATLGDTTSASALP
jgi:hypothetical protein